MNEKLKKYIEIGKKASKEAQNSNTSFYDMLDNIDINDDLELKMLKHQKAIATADNTFANGIRSLVVKNVNLELKALKENK